MTGHGRKCTGHPRKSSGHATKWQDKLENVQDILAILVDMPVNGRTWSYMY